MKAHFVMMAGNRGPMRGVFRISETLPRELYHKEVGVYFKSLHGTLTHVLVGDQIWMRRLTGLGSQPDKLSSILFDDLPSLRAARVQEDGRIIDFVRGLPEPALGESCDYQTLNGTPQRQLRREVLAHFFNHQTHHRGQAHAILTLLGISEPEPLDLLVMQRETG